MIMLMRPCRRCRIATANTNGYCDSHQSLACGWVAYQRGRTSSQRGYGSEWQKRSKIIKKRDNFLCVPCFKNNFIVPCYAVDHIVPKSLGGTDSPDNLQSICKACHKEKTAQEARAARLGWVG